MSSFLWENNCFKSFDLSIILSYFVELYISKSCLIFSYKWLVYSGAQKKSAFLKVTEKNELH
jgi:hypothetical protein